MSKPQSRLHFLLTDLTPLGPASGPREPLLDAAVLDLVREVGDHLWKHGEYHFAIGTDSTSRGALAIVACLETLGAVEVVSLGEAEVTFRAATPFARGFVRSYLRCLEARIPIIENWHVTQSLPDDIVGSGLVLHSEERRVAGLRRLGLNPEALSHRRVAFVVIKGRSLFGKTLYLFDYNKNWDMYNLLGGKEELVDSGSAENTARHSCPNCVSAGAQFGQHPNPSPQRDWPPYGHGMLVLGLETTVPGVPGVATDPAPQLGQHLAGPGDLD